MTQKIFRNAFLLGAIVLLVCGALFFALQYRSTVDENYQALEGEAKYASAGLELGGADYLKGLENINRITWIDRDGSVLYDSEHPDLPNQGDYPEVRAALESGVGKGSRNSDSGGEGTLYYAERCADGTVLRLSRPLSAVRSSLVFISPALWIFLLVLMIAAIMAFRLTRQVIAPIKGIDIDNPEPSETYPELNFLVTRLKEQKTTIDKQMRELRRRQKEFAALTDSMAEGLIITDRHGTVLSTNASATRIVRAAQAGNALHFENESCEQVLQDALGGKRGETIVEYNRLTYRLLMNPIFSHKKASGAVILLIDVTEREQRERLRREFSANVSHELKTPLTSISGFAELISEGLCDEEKMREFSGDIYRESQRLITLVDDIIRLSALDEGESGGEPEDVDLLEISRDVAHTLESAAARKSLSFTVEGEHATVYGSWQVLYEMVYNLCDNAVKYNKTGGSVTVSVTQSGGETALSVSDTGIGIPAGEQERIFERFYRVDKSHSKKIGGTGLGLSIVKHGAQAHNAAVSVESELDKGTTITLRFGETPESARRKA